MHGMDRNFYDTSNAAGMAKDVSKQLLTAIVGKAVARCLKQ